MQINFIDVGGSSMNWSTEMDELNFESLYKEVKESGALYSKNIEFRFEEESGKGFIIVGMVRTVGKFEVVRPTLPENK
ncbi:hypothetical protein L1D14_04175 [Vibrio tubiashii]|uniref:hypothetical protein n=1 Tax=Vibrio tubiashii TaxID=29498 RepID=UPI001EFEC66B|nr:hypothetical protein [Vibrio tubiashii]MCG9575428.1 hypothetical protein [Vibrio tubiashii]